MLYSKYLFFVCSIVEHKTESKSDWKSVYRINDKVRCVSRCGWLLLALPTYRLRVHLITIEEIGINIKAKNFLVFQVILLILYDT